MPKLRLSDMDWGNWLYGLVAGAVAGGANSVTAGIAASALDDSRHFQIGSWKSIELMLMTFIMSAAFAMFFYLKQNPMPKIITETKTESVTVSRATTVKTEVAPATAADTSNQGAAGTPPSGSSPASDSNRETPKA